MGSATQSVTTVAPIWVCWPAPRARVEEASLLARLGQGFGSANLDHRLRRTDFSDQVSDPLYPSLGGTLADIETADTVLLIGADIRREAPILGHRVRKAALAGARVGLLHTAASDALFPVAAAIEVNAIGDGRRRWPVSRRRWGSRHLPARVWRACCAQP